jgi:hypothetical protein
VSPRSARRPLSSGAWLQVGSLFLLLVLAQRVWHPLHGELGRTAQYGFAIAGIVAYTVSFFRVASRGKRAPGASPGDQP